MDCSNQLNNFWINFWGFVFFSGCAVVRDRSIDEHCVCPFLMKQIWAVRFFRPMKISSGYFKGTLVCWFHALCGSKQWNKRDHVGLYSDGEEEIKDLKFFIETPGSPFFWEGHFTKMTNVAAGKPFTWIPDGGNNCCDQKTELSVTRSAIKGACLQKISLLLRDSNT